MLVDQVNEDFQQLRLDINFNDDSPPIISSLESSKYSLPPSKMIPSLNKPITAFKTTRLQQDGASIFRYMQQDDHDGDVRLQLAITQIALWSSYGKSGDVKRARCLLEAAIKLLNELDRCSDKNAMELQLLK